MKIKNILILLIVGSCVQLFAQGAFDPDVKLAELSGKKENIGITAGYAVDGEIKWTNSAGYICADTETPFSTKTLTRIASIAKNFTAVAIMQLVEKGQIELNGPIGNYLKHLPEDKKQITVRQLLAHTAGVSQYQGKKEIENTIHYETLQDAMDVFIDRPLLFEPGTKYFYTTYGYVILGRIIEEVSGLSYQAYMRKNIFEVAGMHDTGIEQINEQYSNKSCLYHKGKRKAKEGKQNDLSNRVPGGGFYSTLEDVMKFGNALLDGKFIREQTLDQMIQTESVEYDGNKYGLGWFLYGPPPYENLVIGHSGGQTGCTSQLMIVPKTKTVIVVLSNTSGNYPDIAGFAVDLTAYSEKQ
ncbi:MAG: beta-lactamase family protein [Bacteroidetes bacterium]|nr:beta-lactamase family protein [Bacteroidota bacterium]